MIGDAIQFLATTQNADGGWGPQRGRASGVEATAFTVLALQSVAGRSIPARVERGLGWLTTQQRPDGSWALAPGGQEGSWATALASLGLAAADRHAAAVKGASWLLGQEGRPLGWLGQLLQRWWPQRTTVRLDAGLKGWPWTPGTFSWVEPTAYALIALRKLRAHLPSALVDARIQQGERLIYDRMCAGGGWNYGNSRVFGGDLSPYPDTTAVALIALQTNRAWSENRLSLEALRTMLVGVQSGLALAWSILCLRIYGHDDADWRHQLVASYRHTGFLGETRSIALSLLALRRENPVLFVL